MLTINPSEIILTIINFFLLFFLLRTFLYRPLIKFMDERKKGIEEKMELEKGALETLAQLDEDMDRQRSKALVEAGDIVAHAKHEMEENGKLLLQNSKDRAALNRKKAAVSAAMVSEREKLKIDSNIDRLAHVLAESLLDAQVR